MKEKNPVLEHYDFEGSVEHLKDSAFMALDPKREFLAFHLNVGVPGIKTIAVA